MGPFSFTGQPNAMGGREVGGMANQLAAHMDISNSEHRTNVKEFWNSPHIAKKEGYKAVDLFDAIDEGKIKAVWIMATNPAVSLPDAGKVKRALKKCELVIVSDCVKSTDTTELAHILLPATTWGERDGTVTNSERCISRQHPLITPPGLCKDDWRIVTEVAQAMGFLDAFNYQSSADIFREHAKLSGFRNNGQRQFNISGLSGIDDKKYDQLKPVHWPVTKDNPSGQKRLYNDGVFSTPSGKANFIPVTPRHPMSATSKQYPFILNTGRIRDHWHTMTRTGTSPRLSTHIVEPFIEIHPRDAINQNLKENDLACINSPLGGYMGRVRLSEKQQLGCLFSPIHWNAQFSNQACIGELIQANTDPVSGQPESKHSVANITSWQAGWHGFVMTRNRPQFRYSTYWSRSRGKGFWRYELAGIKTPNDWSEHIKQVFGDVVQDEDWIEFSDKALEHYRAARFKGDRVESVVFISPTKDLPSRDWISTLFEKEKISKKERASLLYGSLPTSTEDVGKMICSCFKVGEKTIRNTIKHQNLKSTDDVGDVLQAGTNCGSCLPEILDLLTETLPETSA